MNLKCFRIQMILERRPGVRVAECLRAGALGPDRRFPNPLLPYPPMCERCRRMTSQSALCNCCAPPPEDSHDAQQADRADAVGCACCRPQAAGAQRAHPRALHGAHDVVSGERGQQVNSKPALVRRVVESGGDGDVRGSTLVTAAGNHSLGAGAAQRGRALGARLARRTLR